MTSAEPTQLPALIDRATKRLAEARTSAEVLEAKNIAEAALHYAKVTNAANDTHADCLRMIVRAEMRMANEIDAGQKRGDVSRRGDNRFTRVDRQDSAVYEELGIDHRRVSEWRDVRDAGEQVVEEAISEALAEGRAPTKADIRRRVAPPPPKPLQAPSNGLQFARIAIMNLEQIRDDDVERSEAFTLVREWIDAREA